MRYSGVSEYGEGCKGIIEKTILFLIPLFLYSPMRLFCQQFKIGFIGGIATSQVDGDTYAGYNKVGLFAGGFVTKKFSAESKWSASFEITYIQKGSRKTPHPDKGDPFSYKLNLNYAEVPILFKRAFTTPDSLLGQKAKFEFEAGIAIGVLVQSKEEDTGGPVAGGVPFQKYDIPFLLGLNYPVSDHFSTNIRYEYSILPVRKGAIGQYYQNWTYKILKPGYYNNLLLFSLRYQI